MVIEDEVYTRKENVAKAIMQWITAKDYLEHDVTTLRKFTLDELKLRAGYAESLDENEAEYKKAFSLFKKKYIIIVEKKFLKKFLFIQKTY